MKITLTTPFVSTNRLYTVNRNGSRRKTVAGRVAALGMKQEAHNQYKGAPLAKDIYVIIKIYKPFKRGKDTDNTKGIFDAMTGILWKDDGLIVDIHHHKRTDPENPRVEIATYPTHANFIKAICNLPA